MMGPGGGLRITLCRNLILCLSLATIIVGSHAQVSSCSSNTVPSDVKFKNPVSVSFCNSVTVKDAMPSTSYTLWYDRTNSTNATTLSVILGVPKESSPRWYGMGFNGAPNIMLGTAAIIFWLSPNSSNTPVVNTYYLSDRSVSGVVLDDTHLKYKVQPQLIATSDSLYLGFELDKADDAHLAYLNFVISKESQVPTTDVITTKQTTHQGVSSVVIDFTTNKISVTTSDIKKKAKTHGILNIIGWGVVLPHGAIVARYFKSFDPYWLYAHAALQVVGYTFIVGGLVTGFKLLDDVHKLDPSLDADKHKGLAIFVFVLGCIQLTAALLRPKKDTKVRRYWNWGHWWNGRLAMVLAIVNIFVGIDLANGGKDWNFGYGVTLVMEVVLVIGLEAWTWIKYSKAKRQNGGLPQTAMQNRAPHYESSYTDT